MFLRLQHLYKKRKPLCSLYVICPFPFLFFFVSKNEGEKGKNICSDTKATAACSMGEVSIESRDSNQSAGSTASFAFPVYVGAFFPCEILLRYASISLNMKEID